MSKLLVDQDWETNATPVSFANTCARSTTNAIDGTDIRGGDGTAKDGSWGYTIPVRDRLTTGGSNRHGVRCYARFKFKRVSGPTGGLLGVFNFQTPDGNWYLTIADSTTKLQFQASGTTTAGTTNLTAGTAYWIDIDIRDEGSGSWWARIYLNGVLEIEKRYTGLFGAVPGFKGPQQISGGVSASAKCSWEAVWGRMKVWLAHDPK